VAVRDRDGNETRGVPLDTFVEAAVEEARTRALQSSRF